MLKNKYGSPSTQKVKIGDAPSRTTTNEETTSIQETSNKFPDTLEQRNKKII